MKILLTTGGTGGHIYPALTLADYLTKTFKDVDVLFIGNSDRMEATIIPEKGYRFLGITAAKFNESKNKLKGLKTLYQSYKHCIKVVEEYNPDVVVGFGGYVTVPVVMAAIKLKIKTVIHEQNSFVGMANKMLGHYVDKVVTVYPNANDSFSSRKVSCLGNPRESEVFNITKNPSVISSLGLDASRKTILIVMGSLGSGSINEKMISILKAFEDKPYNVIYVTGKDRYEDVVNQISSSEHVKILPYIDQLNVANNCDLIVSRGGATSACEYMALGLPAIIIPSPYVTNNHQFFNAKSMADNGGCEIIEEKDLNEETLVGLIDTLIFDEEKLSSMSLAMKQMSHPNAAEDISKLILDLTGEKYERIAE